MTMNQDIKQRALAIGLPFKTWARLASQSDMTIHSPEISNWFDNYPMREEKQKRLLAALAAVEDLVAADPEVRIDLTSAGKHSRCAKTTCTEAERTRSSAVEISWRDRYTGRERWRSGNRWSNIGRSDG